MLEALVLSLGLADQSYFIKEDLRDRFIGLLENLNDQRVAVLIGAPVLWDMAKYPDMPFFVAYKWTTGPNVASFFPPDFGFIVLSSVNSDEIRIVPLVDNSHKMPMSREPKKSPPPPGTNLNKLTIGYDGQWNGLPAQGMGWAGAEMTAAIVCGPAVSNVRKIKLANHPPAETKRSQTSVSKGPDYYYVKTKQSPQIPESPGITISVPEKMKIVPGEPSVLYGSFLLPDTKGHDVLIHLLFSQPSNPGLNSYTVSIPYAACEHKDTMSRGYFIFDLMNTMYWKPGQRFDVPEKLFVSIICRGIYSEPKALSFIRE